MTTRIIDNSDAKKVFVNILMKRLPKENLEEFRKALKTRIVVNNLKGEILEFNPPKDGVAYSSKDFMHVSMTGGRGGFCLFERYWDKDGNPIGFSYEGQKYMFDKNKMPEQGQEIGDQSQPDKANVALNSDLVQAMTKAVAENDNMEIYGTEVLAIEPAIDGVAFVQKARGVAALARNGSDIVEKSVWFDAVRLYDAKGAFLGMQVTDESLFNEYNVANSGLVKASDMTTEMVKKANKKLEAVRDANGNIIELNLIAMSKKQQFERGQTLIVDQVASKVPENSELARYLQEFPDAMLKQGPGGWFYTELLAEDHPDLKFSFQRIRMWNKDGQPGPVIKGKQKEM